MPYRFIDSNLEDVPRDELGNVILNPSVSGGARSSFTMSPQQTNYYDPRAVGQYLDQVGMDARNMYAQQLPQEQPRLAVSDPSTFQNFAQGRGMQRQTYDVPQYQPGYLNPQVQEQPAPAMSRSQVSGQSGINGQGYVDRSGNWVPVNVDPSQDTRDVRDFSQRGQERVQPRQGMSRQSVQGGQTQNQEDAYFNNLYNQALANTPNGQKADLLLKIAEQQRARLGDSQATSERQQEVEMVRQQNAAIKAENDRINAQQQRQFKESSGLSRAQAVLNAKQANKEFSLKEQEIQRGLGDRTTNLLADTEELRTTLANPQELGSIVNPYLDSARTLDSEIVAQTRAADLLESFVNEKDMGKQTSGLNSLGITGEANAVSALAKLRGQIADRSKLRVDQLTVANNALTQANQNAAKAKSRATVLRREGQVEAADALLADAERYLTEASRLRQDVLDYKNAPKADTNTPKEAPVAFDRTRAVGTVKSGINTINTGGGPLARSLTSVGGLST